MDGLLLIDKPSGPTSFDVVRETRKTMNMRRVGHAGTLDPLASGLLVVCIGQGTKLVPYLMEGEKQYQVRVLLGAQTDTLDADGKVVVTKEVPPMDNAKLKEVLSPFIGTIDQVPPKYSAIKVNGQALHRRVRRGEKVEVKSRKVQIDAIEVLDLERAAFTLSVRCHKGTYIRSLARDIAIALGTVGHVATLRRSVSSGFQVENAIDLDQLKTRSPSIIEHVIPLSKALPTMPTITLNPTQEASIRYGQSIAIDEDVKSTPSASVWQLINEKDCLVALAERDEKTIKPIRVFPLENEA